MQHGGRTGDHHVVIRPKSQTAGVLEDQCGDHRGLSRARGAVRDAEGGVVTAADEGDGGTAIRVGGERGGSDGVRAIKQPAVSAAYLEIQRRSAYRAGAGIHKLGADRGGGTGHERTLRGRKTQRNGVRHHRLHGKGASGHRPRIVRGCGRDDAGR